MSSRRSSKKETLSVIDEIRRLREGGGGLSRLDQYEENEAEEEDDIFETVTDDTYKEIVSKRKRDQFVVNGEDDGYYDDGEDNWDDDQDEDRVGASKNKRAKRSPLDSPSVERRAKQKKLSKKHRAAAGNRSISSMFAKAPSKPKKKAKMKAFNPKDFNFDDSSDDDDADVAPIGGEHIGVAPSAGYDDDYDFENDPSAHNSPLSRRSMAAEPLSSQTNMRSRDSHSRRKGGRDSALKSSRDRFGLDDDEDTHMGDLGYTPPSPQQSSHNYPAVSSRKKSKPMPRSALRTPGSSRKARMSSNDPSARRVSFSIDDQKHIEPVSGSSPPRASDNAPSAASVPRPMDDDDVKPPPRKASKLDESSSPSEVPQWSMTQSSRFIPTPSKSTPQKKVDDASRASSFDLDDGASLRVYWFDAYEDPYKMPGTVFLFGKVLPPNAADKSEPVSCCVIVHNVERNVYFLPRTKRMRKGREGAPVKQGDVVNEVQRMRESARISKMKMKFVKRKYSFDARKDGVPYETSYLKASYSYKEPAIPRHMAGETFSRVFGTQTSALEHFIVKRDLMGPCWINIQNAVPSQNRLSWCKQEFIVDTPKSVTVLRSTKSSPLPPTPKFSVMSMRFIEAQNEKTRQKEIVGLTALVHESVSVEGETPEKRPDMLIGCVRPPTNTALPFDFAEKAKAQGRNVKKFDGEREMLSYFLARLQQLDPDVLVGHGLHRFQVELLLQRIKACGVPNWSRIGRLKKSKIPTMNHVERGAASGRLCVDTWVSAKELVHEKTYTLTELCKTRLKKARTEIDIKQVPVRFRASKSLFQMFDWTYNDCHLQYKLMQELKVLPLTRQLTELCGNMWSRSLQSRRAERNEYLLLHKFHKLKFVAPENYTRKERDAMKAKKPDGSSKKAQFSGGLVLEPERGFYDKLVVLLDYASLYPSIIQEYNICFTTVKHWEMKDDSDIPDEPSRTSESYLPEIIGHLLHRRREVKKLLKAAREQKERMSLDIRQKALKLVANSMYGCLGFEHSRFYCKPMAALITALGRKNLTMAKEKAEQTQFDPPVKVIYGDTDSIMVHTGIDDMAAARKIAREIQKEVNKPFKYMELELDGIFRGMLLLRKKKYAANVITERHGKMHTERELKGLDLVRRDWCTLSKELGQKVLNELLSMEQSREDAVSKIHDLLTEMRNQLDGNQIPAGKFIITKSLTKDPRQYSDAKSHPHVQVAMQMRKDGEQVAQGSHIPYVIVINKAGGALTKGQQDADQPASTESISMRAVSAKRVVRQNERNTPKDKWLHIDKQWYLEHQILPPIARLIEVIPETSAGQLAECLGLDASKYNKRAARTSAAARTDDDDEQFEVDRKDPERFSEWPLEDRIPLACRHCQATARDQGRPYSPRKWKDVFNLQVDGSYLLKCGVSTCPGNIDLLANNDDVTFLQNALHTHFRTYVQRYYRRELQCDDPVCHHRTRAHYSKRCPVTGCQGSLLPMYPASKLYEQLSYYKSCFDLDEAVHRFSNEQKKREESYKVRSRGDPNAERPIPMLDDALAVVPVAARSRLQRLHRFVDSLMNSSRHNFVNLSDLFSFAR